MLTLRLQPSDDNKLTDGMEGKRDGQISALCITMHCYTNSNRSEVACQYFSFLKNITKGQNFPTQFPIQANASAVLIHFLVSILFLCPPSTGNTVPICDDQTDTTGLTNTNKHSLGALARPLAWFKVDSHSGTATAMPTLHLDNFPMSRRSRQ